MKLDDHWKNKIITMDQNDLDIDMAQLEINERKRFSTGVFKYKRISNQQASSELDDNVTHPRRSARKKIRPLETEKRRVLTKPKKFLDSTNEREINNYYLDKRVKRLPPSLETIFEEPKGDNFMSSRKFRRSIQFNNDLTLNKDKAKVKKRNMKAKQVCVIKRLNKKMAMDLLQQKLSSIEDEEQTILTDECPNLELPTLLPLNTD